MLLIYTILFTISMGFYYLKLNFVASVIMIALAIFLYVAEFLLSKRLINVRGLFALGFIGGFAISLLKLSKLSAPYSMITFLAVFVSYFSLYVGTYFAGKKKKDNKVTYKRIKMECIDFAFTSQEMLIIGIAVITFLSFVVEAVCLGFIPLFTKNTPHAYSTFHVFGLHYITTLYVFIPSIAICNFMVSTERKKSLNYVFASFIYVIVMSVLMVSRSQLILSLVLALFTFIIFNGKKIPSYFTNKKTLIYILAGAGCFIILYLIITINRAHNIEYLKGIFEMKNEKMPIFLAQPYMYIAHNFENLNYMINNIFRFTFGRRSLYPLFTLTLIKKFFPIVVDSPYYIIKEELSTVTLIYDFYYDFGLVGIIIFCYIFGYIGKKLEDKTYFLITEENFNKNNYIVLILALYSYIMFFSFFQTYFSLTDIWVQFIFLGALSLFYVMNKKYPHKLNKMKLSNSSKKVESTDKTDEVYTENTPYTNDQLMKLEYEQQDFEKIE